ncbi:MAG: threonylcarbamoyl-AMP synthase [Gammaproteobacteria bacterium GWF2_41_13]|nr:MAG: threonylcarbamoyl-AMP synthase [Gammaproteobacteria bacterium GWF2_41_13]
MALFLHIHPDNPQARLLKQAIEIIKRGGIIIYPTDSGYALGCQLDNKAAADRIRQIRQLSETHHFTLMCRDLSEIATYAVVDNATYRLLKAHTPGAYTFLLKATPEVPRRLQHPKRKSIGIRVPDCRIALDLLAMLNEPLMSVSLIMPQETDPLFDPEEIYERLQNLVDIIIDGGYSGLASTSVIDLYQSNEPVIVREGSGDLTDFRNSRF